MSKKTIMLTASLLLGSAGLSAAAEGTEETITNDSRLSSMYGQADGKEIYSEDNIEIPPQQQETRKIETSKQILFSEKDLHKKLVCYQQTSFQTNSPAHSACQQKLTVITKIIKERFLSSLGQVTVSKKPLP